MTADPLTAWLMVPDAPDLNAWFAELTRRPQWHSLAACRGMGPSSFVTARGQPVEPAKALCAACAVREPCLAYAVADSELVGVWAGTTGTERRLLRMDATDPGPEPGAVGG